ncbi:MULTISPECIES: Gfo/Idh/MocA family protein [Mameliella]|uniref:Gfo/Idh/MocA family protein n=1 Tax=Mameliella TaxID=1434019 RepID=UPI0008411D6D|nr:MULTISPECIES: Gfo/Idh/MocA family oxidoreductase [Mameliella]MDD9730628.1 Gfo/Idh/MocA family oxidoreductase [Mameliella sp. AT18]ODM48467.1 oxidoreductase [Ruegeria sp. PBVC088]OWV42697.1 gfo/Idh/MocA family oxidoreductase [Mameliella alba]OWV63473.1 gfo/Idh/MocA family oxidoreductase [Mameliella alba]
MTDLAQLRQSVEMPESPKPVVIFGAGSIVTDAHLPAYRDLGVPVAGIFDPDSAKAVEVAEAWGTKALASMEEAVGQGDAVYDLAVPPVAIPGILEALPDGAVAIIQKPLGSDLAEADAIIRILRRKGIKAAVNFQLRFAPMSLALKDAVARGLLGEIVDFDAWLALDTPWHLWEFLADLPRVEILLHSIHYLDFVRDLMGNPQGVHARTMGHPSSTVSNTRTAMMLDYGDKARCALSINHNHSFGRKFQACEFRICGTKGAAYMKLGVNLDYPNGEPDELWLNTGGDWEQVDLQGNWFIAAFHGRFAQVQRFVAGLDDRLEGSAEDAWHTMALVEAAYESSARPMHPIKEAPDA